MKTKTEADTRKPLEERFQRFAKALMAVPKKELDKELDKHDAQKAKGKRQSKSRS
jgi:hypothetical protein